MDKQFVVCKSNGCNDMSFITNDVEENLGDKHENHGMMLDLSVQKTGNIFVADQTPTPTRLIKNCEEVGLFDDLRHVNPFEETFRRACRAVEQNVCPNTRLEETHVEDSLHIAEDLHTPQVFPQLEDATADGGGYRCESPTSASVVDLLTVNSFCPNSTSRQNSGGCSSATILAYDKLDKYRIVTEKPTPPPMLQNDIGDNEGGGIRIVYDLPPSMIQLIPSQDVTWYSSPTIATSEASKQARITAASTAIPIQTVKPFILPKQPEPQPSNTHIIPTATHIAAAPTSQQHTHEPSSASLTPTSQLPIKERLKAILNQSSKSRIVELPQKSSSRRPQRGQDPRSHEKYDEDCIERRRAAATRYRVKMRNEYKDLRRQNTELQTDNEKLRQRVRQLEQELAKQQQQFVVGGIPSHIQIPSSTVHVVMNIPKLIVPSNGQPILQNPLTYMVEKE